MLKDIEWSEDGTYTPQGKHTPIEFFNNALKNSYITDKCYVPKGTVFKVVSVKDGSIPYFCRCMTLPITVWLERDQFDFVGRDSRRRV